MRKVCVLLVLVACTGFLGSVSGCNGVTQSVDQLSMARDQAVAIRGDLEDQIDQLELMRESIPDQSVQAKAADALMAQVVAKLGIVEAGILHANQVIQEVQNPSDPLTMAAQAVSPWVPAPIQGPLVLGAALVAAMVRSRSVSNGSRSIVESINHVLKKDDAFSAAFAVNADTIRTIQTPAARKMVDKWSK